MNSSKKLKILLLLFFFASLNLLKANNLQITSVSLINKNTVDDYLYVQFNISWDNSWRISTGAQNWDAAWVFIKFRVNGGEWQHASLSNIDNEHVVPSGVDVDATSDGRGIFLYRSTTGSGNNNWPAVQFKWLYGNDGVADNTTNIEIKVFGIEMVYVNEGPFYLGDGASVGRFWNTGDVNTNPAYISNTPIIVKCENTSLDDTQLEGDGILVDGDGGIDMDGTTSVDNSNFPTGYRAFYCMKHEISNKQYAEFLNTLTRAQQQARTYRDISGVPVLYPFPMNRNAQITSRNCIRYSNPSGGTAEPVYFFCDLNDNGVEGDDDDGENIALCYMGWPDGCAYSDWAGLRPMTELEFEKACRGPENAIPYEFAWHTTNIYNVEYTFDASNGVGTVNSYPNNPGTGTQANVQWQYTTGHDTQHDAPLRVGMFATSSSDRVNSGASYYGILDLSGTMSERCVTLGKSQGRSFQGTHGDGLLSVAPLNPGDATNTDWPGLNDNTIQTPQGSGLRGGDWNDGVNGLYVSNRSLAAEDIYVPANVGPGTQFVS
ncbi:MAG: SUMF1/EgtB/PvdO family nonheme iron enzyme, partial [Chloroflexia bacterium]|nr:SUMF1/EgtB/PvdO family nonheme iron enzyme [Chloroflexia bacterium]